MLTQPIPIGLIDEDDGNIHETNSTIDKAVETARMRESGELTDQLWGVLKGISFRFYLKLNEYCRSISLTCVI